jgi:hypothetical protein
MGAEKTREFGLYAHLLAYVCLLCSPAWSQEVGHIQVKCEPGIKVFLDDVFRGTANEALKGFVVENVPVGDHVLRVVKDGFDPQTEQIHLLKDQVYVFSVSPFVPTVTITEEGRSSAGTLALKVGALVIQSLPVDCNIEIPSLKIHAAKTKDEWRAINLVPGIHKATFLALGKTIGFDVRVSAGVTTRIMVNFLRGEVFDVAQREAERAQAEAKEAERVVPRLKEELSTTYAMAQKEVEPLVVRAKQHMAGRPSFSILMGDVMRGDRPPDKNYEEMLQIVSRRFLDAFAYGQAREQFAGPKRVLDEVEVRGPDQSYKLYYGLFEDGSGRGRQWDGRTRVDFEFAVNRKAIRELMDKVKSLEDQISESVKRSPQLQDKVRADEEAEARKKKEAEDLAWADVKLVVHVEERKRKSPINNLGVSASFWDKKTLAVCVVDCSCFEYVRRSPRELAAVTVEDVKYHVTAGFYGDADIHYFEEFNTFITTKDLFNGRQKIQGFLQGGKLNVIEVWAKADGSFTFRQYTQGAARHVAGQ